MKAAAAVPPGGPTATEWAFGPSRPPTVFGLRVWVPDIPPHLGPPQKHHLNIISYADVNVTMG